MKQNVLQRTELLAANLKLGGRTLDLASYATTGLRMLGIATSGAGKTSSGLLIADQLAEQGWQCVLVDPEGEIESLYGDAVEDEEELHDHISERKKKFVVVAAHNATEFIPYGEVIRECADAQRKPLFVMLDEGQLFSAPRSRKNDIGSAADIVNDFATRGRKRALDLFVTATRFTGSLHRALFASQNFALIGRQEDPTTWSGLAPVFKGTGIGYTDLAALEPGEFICVCRAGVDKVRLPMPARLAKVALKAKPAKRPLPTTFTQWDRAMRDLPTDRLKAMTGPVVELLSAVAGLPTQQILSGGRALRDEIEARA